MFYSFSWNIHNAKAAFPPRGANLSGRKSCNILYIVGSTSVPFVRIHKKQTRPDTGTCPQRTFCPGRKGRNGSGRHCAARLSVSKKSPTCHCEERSDVAI